MMPEVNSIVQPWRKSYAGGSNKRFNPLISTVRQSTGKHIILFVHTGKCAGESILAGMAQIFGADVIIYEYHVFDANERLLEALTYYHDNEFESASVVIATRDPLSRWVSSYNWDLHNLYLSKKRPLSEGYSSYPNVNLLAQGIENGENLAMSFGRFGHMGMGVSWYLPSESHSLLDSRNTYILKTETLDSDFFSFVNKFCDRHELPQKKIASHAAKLAQTKHDFKSLYSKDIFQKFNYSNIDIVDAMHRYLSDDIAAHSSLVRAFSC
jgi:hypothetical protein